MLAVGVARLLTDISVHFNDSGYLSKLECKKLLSWEKLTIIKKYTPPTQSSCSMRDN